MRSALRRRTRLYAVLAGTALVAGNALSSRPQPSPLVAAVGQPRWSTPTTDRGAWRHGVGLGGLATKHRKVRWSGRPAGPAKGRTFVTLPVTFAREKMPMAAPW